MKKSKIKTCVYDGETVFPVHSVYNSNNALSISIFDKKKHYITDLTANITYTDMLDKDLKPRCAYAELTNPKIERCLIDSDFAYYYDENLPNVRDNSNPDAKYMLLVFDLTKINSVKEFSKIKVKELDNLTK